MKSPDGLPRNNLLRHFTISVLDVRLYEGSWKEYASLKQHPAETA